MSRINTNIASMNAMSSLVANNKDLSTRLGRLSSGLRINAGKDDPAGLIASENLRSEMSGLQAGINNSTRASSVIATTEGALNEISALLVDIRGLLVNNANTGGLSQEELDANQLQVDSAINTIQRISNATEFEGIKLLNGNLDYVVDKSALAEAAVEELHVNKALLIDGAAMEVNISQSVSAQTGLAYFNGSGTSTTAMTIQIGSGKGTTELTFAAGTKNSAMVTAINNVKEVTGISANISGGGATDYITLASVDFGTDAYASVEILSGQQSGASDGVVLEATVGGAAEDTVKDYGVNAIATINGSQAIADGKMLKIRTSMLDAEIDLTNAAALSGGWSASFDITGGGADFAIGSKVDAINMESIGIMSVAPSQLGNAADGYLNTLKTGASNSLVGDNLFTAQRIVDSAIKDISTLRGRLGAFQKNTLDTNINSLTVTLENVTASESAIRDADFAAETAAMTRAQVLQQANTSVLSIANAGPQSVLALLG
ncbi:MAG: flagellin [Phycisphaerae bacterium]|nr:flagellin [Phycisphaerae bacterium]